MPVLCTVISLLMQSDVQFSIIGDGRASNANRGLILTFLDGHGYLEI